MADVSTAQGPLPSASITEAARGPRAAQVLLGLFILWQVCFLFAANLLEVLRYYRPSVASAEATLAQVLAPGWAAQEGHVHDLVETVVCVTNRWSHVTGQPQSWGLFAPNVVSECPFVAVELRWEDDDGSAAHAPVLLLSENEPDDVTRFFRWRNFRLRKFESYLDVVLQPEEDETPEACARRWQNLIEDRLRRETNTAILYLRWRRDAYQREHPDRPEPRQLILHVRRYHIPAPNEGRIGWDGPFMEPVARWRPAATPPAGHRPLEAYDPVTRRFEWWRG
jgi:hypothetical protein